MAKNETRRLTPSVVQKDKDTLAALAGIGDYAPGNTSYTTAKWQSARSNMDAAQQAYVQALAAFESARDDVTASEWAFHNLVLGAKEQVVAQYGLDSNEVQSVGLKKKSEYKSPKRNGTPVPAPVA